MGTIQSRAMLASCTVRRWNPRVLDRKISREVQQLHNASADAGDFRKSLVDKAALKALNTSGSAIRALHYTLTLPWDDEGDRMLPSKTFQKYTDEMRKLKTEDERLRGVLYSQYPQLLAAAPARLGSMYDPNDFPSLADLPSKFDIRLSFKPVPDAQDFRVDIGDEAAAALRAQLNADIGEKLNGAVKDCYRRVEKVVSHISSTLHQADPRIFDTLVTNAREVIDCLTDLNVTNDPNLEAVRQELAALLPRNATILRADPDRRAEVANDADALLSKLVNYV